MIKEGCLDGVEEIYGIHNWPLGKEGTISVKSGAMMAGGTKVEIFVKG